VLYKTATCDLANAKIAWRSEPAVSVVIASAGYPGKYEKGKAISGLDKAAATGAVVFHAGTAFKDGEIVSAGGRVLGVSALGKDMADAIANAYKGVAEIAFDGAYYRKDIGAKALKKR
jgi:phosphoribosylamine--glycine ligase